MGAKQSSTALLCAEGRMGLLTRLLHRTAAAPLLEEAELAQALELAATRVDPQLTQARGWPRSYRAPLLRALAQARTVAAGIPGPVELGVAEYVRSPLIHALFPSYTTVTASLDASPALREYPGVAHTEVYALLSARRMTRDTLGIECDDGRLRRDVRQQLVWFTDHRYSCPAANEAATRHRVQWMLFERLLERVTIGLKVMREEHQRLLQEKDRLLARLHQAPGQQDGLQQELTALLRQLAESMQALELNQRAEVFDTVLSHPEDCLYLERYRLHLDAMGTAHASANGHGVATLDFTALHERYREPRTVVLVHCRLPGPR